MSKVRNVLIILSLLFVQTTLFSQTPIQTMTQAQVLELGFNATTLDKQDFNMLTVTGEKITKSTFAGKYVFLTFYATWCPDCQKELPVINKLAGDLKNSKSLVFVNISVNDNLKNTGDEINAMIKEFIEKFGITNMQLNRDLEGRPSKENYQVKSIPSSFLVAPDGKVLGEQRLEWFDWAPKTEVFKKYFK